MIRIFENIYNKIFGKIKSAENIISVDAQFIESEYPGISGTPFTPALHSIIVDMLKRIKELESKINNDGRNK